MLTLSSSLIGALVVLFGIFSTSTAASTSASSGFVANDGSIAFAINLPRTDNSSDIYFSMQGDASKSWIAIGMGSSKMKNSLVFMVYKGSTGKNITLSPRLSYGHTEPSYSSSISIELLPGTTITSDNNYTVFAKCSNCRSWKGGSIDPTNNATNFIYAGGPKGNLNTNNQAANIWRHSSYGIVRMDLTLASGSAGVPGIPTTDTSGTVQVSSKDSDSDFASPFHGALMIFAFVVVMPVGLLILRVMHSVKWHGLNQSVSAGMALLGTIMGLVAGAEYTRTVKFNSAHQIIGILVVVAMVGQFVLGYMHHRIYKRTQTTTKLAPVHVWLGRVVIPAGILDGFLGFPLALSPIYDLALLGLVVIVAITSFAVWRWQRNTKATPVASGLRPGAPAHPSRSALTATNGVDLGAYLGGSGHQIYPPLDKSTGQYPTQGREFV